METNHHDEREQQDSTTEPPPIYWRGLYALPYITDR